MIGGHLSFNIKMTLKHFINTRNIFLSLQLVMLEVLLKFLCHIINPRWPPVVILNYSKSFSEIDRESFALA